MHKTLLRVFVSLLLIGALFFVMRDEFPKIAQTLRGADRGLLASATLIFLTTVLIMAKRLQLIFEAEDVPIAFRQVSSLTFVGYFFNNFLPTSVGGDIVKALCAARITGESMKSATSVLMDRLFGLFTFILIPSLSVLFLRVEDPLVPMIIYGLLAASLFIFFMIFNRGLARRFQFIEKLLHKVRAGETARRVYDGLHNFKNHKRVVAEAMMLSIAGQSVGIAVLYLAAVAMGVEANLGYFFIVIPVVHLLSMVPSLNGLGPREWAFVYLLSPDIGRASSAALSIVWLFFLLLLSAIGGVIYLLRHDFHIRFGPLGAGTGRAKETL